MILIRQSGPAPACADAINARPTAAAALETTGGEGWKVGLRWRADVVAVYKGAITFSIYGVG